MALSKLDEKVAQDEENCDRLLQKVVVGLTFWRPFQLRSPNRLLWILAIADKAAVSWASQYEKDPSVRWGWTEKSRKVLLVNVRSGRRMTSEVDLSQKEQKSSGSRRSWTRVVRPEEKNELRLASDFIKSTVESEL